MQKLLPIIFFALFSAGIIATAAVSLLYNQQIGDSISEIFVISRKTLDESADWIKSARDPLVGIKDEVVVTVDDIRDTLNGTDFIEKGLDIMIGKLEDFETYTSDVTLPRGCVVSGADDKKCFKCEFCTTISNEVRLSNDQIKSASDRGIDDLVDIKRTLKLDLVDIKTEMSNKVNEQVDATQEIILSIEEAKDSISTIEESFNSQDQMRNSGFLSMFALAIVVIAIGSVGVLLGLTPLRCLAFIIHIAYMLGFIALFIGFMVAAMMIAFSVLFSDVCEVSDLMSQDWGPVMGRDAATGLNACFHNESLLVAYNLTGSLNFSESLQFPDINFDILLDFSDFEAFEKEIKKTTSDTFNLDQATKDAALVALRGLTERNIAPCNPNETYTYENLLEPWKIHNESANDSISAKEYVRRRYSYNGPLSAKVAGCGKHDGKNFSDMVAEAYDAAATLQNVELDSKKFVDDMKVNISIISDYVDKFGDDIKAFGADINRIKVTLKEGLIEHVDKFKASMYCSFLATNFDLLMSEMCQSMMPAFTMISLMVFFMALFLIPVNICLIILCKRLRSTGGGVAIDEETEFK